MKVKNGLRILVCLCLFVLITTASADLAKEQMNSLLNQANEEFRQANSQSAGSEQAEKLYAILLILVKAIPAEMVRPAKTSIAVILLINPAIIPWAPATSDRSPLKSRPVFQNNEELPLTSKAINLIPSVRKRDSHPNLPKDRVHTAPFRISFLRLFVVCRFGE